MFDRAVGKLFCCHIALICAFVEITVFVFDKIIIKFYVNIIKYYVNCEPNTARKKIGSKIQCTKIGTISHWFIKYNGRKIIVAHKYIRRNTIETVQKRTVSNKT